MHTFCEELRDARTVIDDSYWMSLADHLENTMRPLTEEETKIFFEKLNK